MSEQPLPEGAMEAAEELHRQLSDVIPEAIEVGVGFKEVGGEITDVICIRVYVPRKLPLEEIPSNQVIPETFNGFSVDIVEGTIELISDPARYDPLRGGIEISRPGTPLGTIGVSRNPGTLGAVVARRTDAASLLLTCEHVSGPVGTDVSQPATGSPNSQVVGVVSVTDVDLDCAAVEPNGTRALASDIQDIGPVSGSGPLPAPGAAVKKRGARTLLTHGTTLAILPRQNPATGRRWSDIEVAPAPGTVFATHGDSGSALVNGSDEVVGLVYGTRAPQGTPVSAVAVAIDVVLDALDVDIAVGLTPSAPPFPGRLLRYPPLTIGDDVQMWQEKMVDRGETLAVDGKYGRESKAACIRLQQAEGLPADGIVGPLTWDATFAD